VGGLGLGQQSRAGGGRGLGFEPDPKKLPTKLPINAINVFLNKTKIIIKKKREEGGGSAFSSLAQMGRGGVGLTVWP
jgi:hypothetical protein